VVKPVNVQEFIKVVTPLGVFLVRLNEPPPGSVKKSKEVKAAGEVH
jgi:hypothetical protein